jgi:ParB family protein of integrating conjugative element (PFGI_1 class)
MNEDKVRQLTNRPLVKPDPHAARKLLSGVADAINSDAPAPEAPEPERYIKLPLHMIQIYERNPRTTRNAQHDEIKEALRAEGLGKVLLHVTKRPGESIYTLAFGGGTRFRIIQELHTETGEDRFATVRCLIQPFKSDLALQANHLIENNQRGDMSFWENAVAFTNLFADMGSANGEELTIRPFVDRCNELGLRVNRTSFNFYQFAITSFSQFAFCSQLSRTAIERIQPQFAAYERLVALRGLPNLNAIQEIQPVLGRLDGVWEGGGFELNVLLKGTDLAIASALGLSLAEMPKAIDYSKEKFTTSWEKLMARLRPVAVAAATKPPAPEPTVNVQQVQARLSGSAPMPTYTPTQLRAVMPVVAPVPLSTGTPLQRIQNLAKSACIKLEIDKQLRSYDNGFGWYLEPITTEHVMREKLDDYTRSRLDLWSLMSQLSGQWHEDMFLRLPETSLWRRAMTKQAGVTAEERQAIALVPNAQIAFANFMIGLAPWGSRRYFFSALNNVEQQDPHDDVVALMDAHFALMRAEPERFAHVRQNAKGEPREVRNGDWE